MSARFLAPLGLCALLFTGCDFIDEIQQEPPVAVTIESVEVTDLRQRPWDREDDTGPDLFAEVQDPGGGTYVRSETIQDADLTQAFTFTFPEGFEVATSTSNMFVTIFDDDGDRVTAEVVGVSAPFTASDLDGTTGSLFLLDFAADDGREATYTLNK